MSLNLKVRRNFKNPEFVFLELKPKARVFFMGVCGTAMASLALHLKKEGYEVSGSDQNIYPPMSELLEKKGLKVTSYNEKNISSHWDLIVIGNVMRADHSEVQKVEELNIPYINFPEFMEQAWLQNKKNIVVAGTHGKSTTTAIMAHIAQTLDKNPGFFMGGVSENFQTSFSITKSPWFVIEGDEYDCSFYAKHPKFYHYKPFALILTSVEFDHGDIYKDIDEVEKVFIELVKKVPSDGIIVAFETERIKRILKQAQARVVTFGLGKGDYQLKTSSFQMEKLNLM